MFFGEDDVKECDAGCYQEIINKSSVITTSSLHDNGKDKDVNSAETDENARVARLRSRRKAGELHSEKRRHKKSTKSPLEFT